MYYYQVYKPSYIESYIYYFPHSFYMTEKKETISLKINPELWKKAKHHCLDKDLKYSEYVEGLIEKDLAKK